MRAITCSVIVRIFVLTGITLLSGCETYDSFTQSIAYPSITYRTTVVQGNFVSAETASTLQVGMSRDKVRSLLGTPLLTDMFHIDRWDYVFYIKRPGTAIIQKRDLVINFGGDLVADWTGANDLPSEREFIAEIDSNRKSLKKWWSRP
ncbi:outer membrane protein assembly factor BamE [Candidatus Vallotiella sp. (ex Adelges kitamiensis)]|uniref:outer membrane protein assembly factor BamE n=1 Tax=Candidatus Vallotiella sp. (ex Adelges kitamiensis) TaxID=2864217 RepID=UPI00403DB40D